MILVEMPKKLLVGAVATAGLAVDVARHLAWYVAHQVAGRPRTRGD
jgi:hypothetical protein